MDLNGFKKHKSRDTDRGNKLGNFISKLNMFFYIGDPRPIYDKKISKVTKRKRNRKISEKSFHNEMSFLRVMVKIVWKLTWVLSLMPLLKRINLKNLFKLG